MQNWQAQNIDNAEYIGVIEIEDPHNDDEYHVFSIVKTDTHLVFGTACNIGLLESGNYLIDDCFSIDSNLSELIADIECYYQDGPGCQSDNFSHNDRM